MKIGASGATPSSFKISKNLKKISYQSRRNFFLPQFVKNLLPKWSVFVRIFYKNNSISFFCLLPHSSSFGGVPDLFYLFYLRYDASILIIVAVFGCANASDVCPLSSSLSL